MMIEEGVWCCQQQRPQRLLAPSLAPPVEEMVGGKEWGYACKRSLSCLWPGRGLGRRLKKPASSSRRRGDSRKQDALK